MTDRERLNGFGAMIRDLVNSATGDRFPRHLAAMDAHDTWRHAYEFPAALTGPFDLGSGDLSPTGSRGAAP
jgi:hypothetical protein